MSLRVTVGVSMLLHEAVNGCMQPDVQQHLSEALLFTVPVCTNNEDLISKCSTLVQKTSLTVNVLAPGRCTS